MHDDQECVASIPRESRQGRAEFLALMAAASATIAISIDAMLPAFGAVRASLGLPSQSSSVALIVTVFMAGLGVGQIVCGPLADRLGRKPVFLAGLILFVAAGFATTLATSLEGILVGRFLWGIGAAAPRIVSQALLRDRLRGDELARAMAIILTVFLIVPTLAPIAGKLALELGSWRAAFAIGPIFGAVVALWSLRLDESLAPSARRSIDVRSLARAFAEVARNRRAFGNTVALTAMAGAFLPYLASSERMYGEIYARPDQFVYWFATSAIVMAGFTTASIRIVKRIGAHRTRRGALGLLVSVTALNCAVTVAFDGVPPFALFVVATTIMISLGTLLTPLLTSAALDEVGHVAGTAASMIGATSFVVGAMLAAIVDRAIGSTVTPFAAAFLVLSLVAIVAAGWGNAGAASAGRLDHAPRGSGEHDRA